MMENDDTDCTPPNPYAPALQTRAASEHETPGEHLRAFAEKDKAARLRELEIEHAEIDAFIAATPTPRLASRRRRRSLMPRTVTRSHSMR